MGNYQHFGVSAKSLEEGNLFKVVRNSLVFLVATVFVLSTFFYGVGRTNAASANDIITVNLSVNATISIACTDTVNMGGITGTGQSALGTNSATCTVVTNNSGGYSLTWQASTATMNSGGDTIAAYTPVAPGLPETWSVAGSASEWGGHLGTASTTTTPLTWGADTYAGNWLNVNSAAPFEIANRGTETSGAGDTEVVWFGAEVGASHFQPTGTYTVNVTMTATTQ